MKKYLSLFMMLLLISCGKTSRENRDKAIIPIADVIGKGKILNLSNLAKSIEYVPLITNDSVLVGNITEFIYEKGYFVLYDFQTKVCKTFSKNGFYENSLGKLGNGPGEYTFIRSMSYIPESGHIVLHSNTGIYYIYNFYGNLIEEISSVKIPNKYADYQTIGVTDDLFLTDLISYDDLSYRAILWGKGYLSHIYTKISNPMKNCNILDRPLLDNGAYIWRFRDKVRYYREETDTIFSIDYKMKMEKAFVLDLGNYKRSLRWILIGVEYPGQYINSKTIQVYNKGICESSSFLFLDFNFSSIAPETFKRVKHSPRDSKQRVEKVTSVLGLYNKSTGELTLLNQPVKHKYLGFRNDMDGGPSFWPQYISSDDKMVACWMAEDFLEMYKDLPNPSPELKKIAENLAPDDNPIFMVVTLK